MPQTIEIDASRLRADLRLQPGDLPSTFNYLGTKWRRTGTTGTYNGPIEYTAYVEVPTTPDPYRRPRLLHVWND